MTIRLLRFCAKENVLLSQVKVMAKSISNVASMKNGMNHRQDPHRVRSGTLLKVLPRKADTPLQDLIMTEGLALL